MGREAELGRITALLAGLTAGRGAALLLEGEPGVGKTSLLEAASSMAGGVTCLTAGGAEADASLAYAGLLELVRPVEDVLAEVPDAQAAALRSALGWSADVTGADRFLVAAATLTLLAAAAERRPVLVLVDDLHWLDRESAEAILFAARRLGADAVGFLLSARTGGVAPALVHGVPAFVVPGLSPGEVAALLPDVTTPVVAERLAVGTGGNPLAILEAARHLSPGQRLGAAPLPDPLPTVERLRRHFEETLASLPPDAWQATLLVALSSTAESTATASTVLATAGIDPASALDQTTQRGVLVRAGGSYRFRHPLLRSAVLERATPAQQRAAHAALADALPAGDRNRVWHRVEAALGTDADLAEELVRRADADRERLGYAAASVALERAADLTPDHDLLARRIAFAAHDAFVAGDVERVRGLAQRVMRMDSPDNARGTVLFTLGMLEQYTGSVPLAIEHLTDASHLLAGAPLVRTLTELAIARFRVNDVSGWVESAERIDAVADPSDPEQRLLADFTAGAARVLTGDTAGGMSRLAEVRRSADLPELRRDPRALFLMALATSFIGDVSDAVAVGEARMHEVRRRGALGVLVPLLAHLAAGKAWLGDHAGAFADAGEAAELAELLGHGSDAAVAVEMLAWQQASRDLHDDARASMDRARDLTDRAGTTSAAAHQALASAYCALCRGDLASVVAILEERITLDGGVSASGEPLGVAPLLVEAYVGLRRTDEARSLTEQYAVATPTPATPLAVALVRRCQAITASDEPAASEAFDLALQAHVEARDPFETARTRLLYGSRLRRAGRRVAARVHLTHAHEAFTSMELSHWSAAAADELAATGATSRRRSEATKAPLTSQETRVALLVAQGLSNREIGASLFLSPKTIERHLSNIFRKRGFRSRTELAAAFARTIPSG